MNNGSNPYAPFTKKQVEAAIALLNSAKEKKPNLSRGRPFSIDWESVDWTKQNRDIASELSTNPSYVGLMRRKLGKPKSPRHWSRNPKLKENNRKEWKSWDWSKTDAELGRQHSLCRERTRQIRKLLGFKPSPRGGNRKYDWSKVDWNQNNKAIASKLGTHPSNVSLRRAVAGGKSSYEINREARLARWRTWDWTLYDATLARLHHTHPTRVGLIRKQLGLPRSCGQGKYQRNPRHAYKGK